MATPSSTMLFYACENWPPDDGWARRGGNPESLEDYLNQKQREGKTLAFVINLAGQRHATLVFTSPVSYP